jgi:hypothetical protein
MLPISIEGQLDLLDEQIGLLSVTLIDGSPQALQSASAGLQILSVQLLKMLEVAGCTELLGTGRIATVRALAGRLASVRENLFRLSAHADRALALLVPATQQKSTYPGSRTYGGPVRQSGAFSVFAA